MSALVGIVLAALFALATALLGWWAVPLVAAVAGAALALRIPALRRAPLLVGLSAALGWALLLAREAVRGPVGLVAAKVGAVIGVPGPALVLVTLLFPLGLGWSAARLARAAAGLGRRQAAGVPERDAGRGEIPAARELGAASVVAPDPSDPITTRS